MTDLATRMLARAQLQLSLAELTSFIEDLERKIDHVEWELTWSFLPRKCSISGELLWMKKAYRGTRWMRTDDFLWRSVSSHLIEVLKTQ